MIYTYLKKIAVVTLFFFIWFTLGSGLAHSENMENQIQKTEKIKSEKVNGEKEIGPSGDRDKNEPTSPNVVEKPATKKKKKKKFPVLLVVVGAIAIGAILYFVLKKKAKDKKFDLTVNVGEGVTGTPASGTYTYKKGEMVNYNYSLQSGYTDLTVLLDGQAAAASGTITMNADHSLVVSTTPVGMVEVKSSPTGANIYMDGSDTGKTTDHTFVFSSAGTHSIVLRKLGYKEVEVTVNAVLGQTKTVNKILEPGLKEDFNTNAESSILWKWEPLENGNWAVMEGNYVAEAAPRVFNYSIYNYNFAASKYTVTVKMKRSKGEWSWLGHNCVLLATGANGKSISGYYFAYSASGRIWIYKLRNWDMTRDRGSIAKPIASKQSGAVIKYLGNYNTMKIVRDGNNYTFYINDQKVNSFSDSKYDPNYIFIGGSAVRKMTKLEFNYVYLDIGNTSASVIGPPIRDVQDKQNILD